MIVLIRGHSSLGSGISLLQGNLGEYFINLSDTVSCYTSGVLYLLLYRKLQKKVSGSTIHDRLFFLVQVYHVSLAEGTIVSTNEEGGCFLLLLSKVTLLTTVKHCNLVDSFK